MSEPENTEAAEPRESVDDNDDHSPEETTPGSTPTDASGEMDSSTPEPAAPYDENSADDAQVDSPVDDAQEDPEVTPSPPPPPPPRRSSNSLVSPPVTIKDDDDDDLVEVDEDSWITAASNMRNPKRKIWVVTTAALPWRTGTAVNPLLRALYLTRGRKHHAVTLVIPWLSDKEDQANTLANHYFGSSDEQETWIRDYCRTRAGCEEEEKKLRIMFYPATYHQAFGSIFPTCDICSLIPNDEADVAILEEPEHLNWLRVPPSTGDEEKDNGGDNEQQPQDGKSTDKEKAELGWNFKFRHVVGIIHTNYKAYAEQYGMGAKFITAPALNALNALVIRAYCRRAILLSATLPSLVPHKEVTCNVHGVRPEFLDTPCPSDEVDEKLAPVYFIGKLIWAKGFDKMLDLQNMYREKHGEYFPIDVYGAGKEEKPIKRGFFGRIPQIRPKEAPPAPSDDVEGRAEVFTWETSLRAHLVDKVPFTESERHLLADSPVKRRASTGEADSTTAFSPQSGSPETQQHTGSSDDDEDSKPRAQRHSILGLPNLNGLSEKVLPLSVLGGVTHNAVGTAKATTGAAVAIAKNVVSAGLNVAFTNESNQKQKSENGTTGRKSPLVFDPPQSVFEFRRNPIPARFLGPKDHIEVRDLPKQKIFINMSITEVLCTTSAEALAMGKFVVLPKHPSNTFFFQFPNCLPYSSLEECLEKLDWALKNDPQPLSEETARKISWEGANERLFEAGSISKDEFQEWQETGKLKSDADAARFHVETGKKGQLIGKFFSRDKKESSS